ncbi:MAG: hypothetical protein RR922_05350 [Clostridia bacterium]
MFFVTTLYANANLTNKTKEFYTRYNAAELAVNEMENVLAQNYMNIAPRPERRVTKGSSTYYVYVEVEKYSDEYMEKQDLVKTVTVNVKYTLRNKEKTFEVKTLTTR